MGRDIMTDQEIFLPIKGYESLYHVSNFGRVKSLSRACKNAKGVFMKKEKILKPGDNPDGYHLVRLYKDRKVKTMKVHRLVAQTFVEGFAEHLVVNHKNGKKKDNRHSNLEWVTRSENTQHAIRTGLKPKIHGLKNKNCKGFIFATRISDGSVIKLAGNKDIKDNGFSPGCVCLCVNGKQSSHKGYYFDRR
jgi:hypothetical protein